MPSAREIYFTKADEAAFSHALREKYPNICFVENRPRQAPVIEYIDSIDVSSAWQIDFFVPESDWRPEFKHSRYREGYNLINLPLHHGSIMRSSNGWGPQEFDDDGEPRWISEGRVHIFYNPLPTKTQRAFRDTVWRLFSRIATWRLKPYYHQPRQAADWEKTDKMIWAGNDAVRWAKENPFRMFSGGQFLYRPLEDS